MSSRGLTVRYTEDGIAGSVESDLLALRNLMKRDPPAFESEYLTQFRHFQAQWKVLVMESNDAFMYKSDDPAHLDQEDVEELQGFDFELLEEDEPDQETGESEAEIGEDSIEQSASVGFSKSRDKMMKKFSEVIEFLSHGLPFYQSLTVLNEEGETEEIKALFMKSIISLLEERYDYLSPYLRKSMVQCLIMLRNRNVVSSLQLFPVFFKLFQCPDKQLRTMIFSHIVNDIAKTRKKNKDQSLYNACQNSIFKLLVDGQESDSSLVTARKALCITLELYRKRVWEDDKTINMIANVCLFQDHQMALRALHFFSGSFRQQTAFEGSDNEEDESKIQNLKKQARMQNGSKMTRKKLKSHSKVQQKLNKLREGKSDSGIDGVEFGPINLLYNPQGFAEKLLGSLKNSKRKFEARLLQMNVISRVIACHDLLVLNIYPFLQKYMRPHQRYVTQIIAYCIQATHSLTPPESLEPIVKTLCNEFVSDKSGPEMMAVGLNSIREICKRQPLCMDEMLLQDLAQYKKEKDKSVVMAARSLIGLFREINPMLLHKNDRGKEATENILAGDIVVPEYGSKSHFTQDVPQHEILGDEELAALNSKLSGGKRKRERDSDNEDSEFDDDSGKVVDPSSLEAIKKQKKRSREEKLEEMKEKRLFGAKKAGGGTTNEEKVRKKPFVLTKYSERVRTKILNSLGVKNKRKAEHIDTMKTRNKHRRRRRRT